MFEPAVVQCSEASGSVPSTCPKSEFLLILQRAQFADESVCVFPSATPVLRLRCGGLATVWLWL